MRSLLWGLALALGLATAGLGADVAEIRRRLYDPTDPCVLVAAHRGDWRNAPENSLSAIRRAVELGVDIVEVDVRRTRDGRFVIIHDTTLDRTTTGRGLVADFTLAQLQGLRLLAATGHPTEEKIPTLEQALDAVRGKAILNLDKAYDFPGEIFAVVEACNSVDFALFSIDKPLDDIAPHHPDLLKKAMLMIVVPLWRPDAGKFIDDYLTRAKPVVVQVVFDPAHVSALSNAQQVRTGGARLWINTIWPELCGGYDDERAVDDPEKTYGWLLAQGATILQTDRPAYLLNYLRSRGRHP